jgi:hypothetical protein
MANVFCYLIQNHKVLEYIESNNNRRQLDYYHIYKRLFSIYNINVENQNEYKIVKNLPTFGQCANVVYIAH